MDFNRLTWVKNVRPSEDYHSHWAYTQEELHSQGSVMLHDGRLPFPLMFKKKGLQYPSCGDSILLTQYAKVTHVVEIPDGQYFERRGLYFRCEKIVWIAPGDRHGDGWSELPHRNDVLKFKLPNQMQTVPYRLDLVEAIETHGQGSAMMHS